MKNILKYIPLALMLIFVGMACSDDKDDAGTGNEPGGERPPVTVPSVVLLEEQFSDNTNYLTSGGTPYPSSFTDGYFERVVSDEVINDYTLRTFLKQCRIDPDEPGITAGGETTSKGRIQIGANTGALETSVLGYVTKISMVLSGGSGDKDAKTKAVIMIKSLTGDWETFAESPEVSGNSPYKWIIDKKIMKYPLAIKIIQHPDITSGNTLAIYELKIEGTLYEMPQEPEPTNVLINEGFYNDGESIKIFKASDGSAFAGGNWNTKEGYFERTIGERTIKTLLHSCRLDYTENRISIYGESTSKGRLQIGTGGGNIEFPVFGSVSKITMALSAGTSGDVVTRALVQYRSKGTNEWKDYQMSQDITANTPYKWVLEDISAEPVAIRIMQDPAITKGNSLAIYDLMVEGTLDADPEDTPDVMLMDDERFRTIEQYSLPGTTSPPVRNTFYEELYFDRVVEGRTLRTKIYQAALQTTTQPPAENNGATQGRVTLNNYSMGGVFETPIYGSVKSIVAKIAATDPGKPSKAVLQIKGLSDATWKDYAVTDELVQEKVFVWEINDIEEKPVALRIIQHPDYSDKLSIYNISIEGKLY